MNIQFNFIHGVKSHRWVGLDHTIIYRDPTIPLRAISHSGKEKLKYRNVTNCDV